MHHPRAVWTCTFYGWTVEQLSDFVQLHPVYFHTKSTRRSLKPNRSTLEKQRFFPMCWLIEDGWLNFLRVLFCELYMRCLSTQKLTVTETGYKKKMYQLQCNVIISANDNLRFEQSWRTREVFQSWWYRAERFLRFSLFLGKGKKYMKGK